MRYLMGIVIIAFPLISSAWGFFVHKKINRLAVFTLPAQLGGFYKKHIEYITKYATRPDERRGVVAQEAPRHFIDIDVYGDSAVYTFPRQWHQAVELYTEDTLMAYGIVPYHVNLMAHRLTLAFENKDIENILRLSADIGHYIADANVPLHTTENYNGQLTNQYGIHGLWESRLPELFFDTYDLLTGQATYVSDLQAHIWEAVVNAHEALNSVLTFEQLLTDKFTDSKKYGYEDWKSVNVKTYSFAFSKAYHHQLNGMVEKHMRSAIKMVGSFWFSCWIKAGQPNLTAIDFEADLIAESPTQTDTAAAVNQTKKFRNHEAFIIIKEN